MKADEILRKKNCKSTEKGKREEGEKTKGEEEEEKEIKKKGRKKRRKIREMIPTPQLKFGGKTCPSLSPSQDPRLHGPAGR